METSACDWPFPTYPTYVHGNWQYYPSGSRTWVIPEKVYSIEIEMNGQWMKLSAPSIEELKKLHEAFSSEGK